MRRIKSNKRLYLYLAAAIVILAALVYGVVMLTSHNGSTIPSSNPLQENASSSQNSSGNTSGSSPSSNPGNSASSNAAPSSGPPPITPYGNFVSSHHPDSSSTEASTCNTSPGAVCYIQFTKGSEVKKLDAHTTDARGGSIWYWNVGDAGLGSGSWTVTAVATLNGQTKTASDVQPLEVQ